jgi:hypothetical protein
LIPKSFITDQLEDQFCVESSSRNYGELLDTVLSWTSSSFNNELLLVDSMKTLPPLYNDSLHWYNSFYPFILDEVRAQLETISKKEFLDIVRYEQCILEPAASYEKDDITTSTFDIYIIFPIEVEQVTVEPFSLALLIYQCPKSITKLDSLWHQLINIEYQLDERYMKLNKKEKSLIANYPDNYIFRATISTGHLFTEILTKKDWSLLILGVGTLAAIRIWDSLGRSESPKLIMDDVLFGLSQYGVSGSEMLVSSESQASSRFTSNFNISQCNAIESVLSVGSENVPRIQLIKGPPGDY